MNLQLLAIKKFAGVLVRMIQNCFQSGQRNDKTKQYHMDVKAFSVSITSHFQLVITLNLSSSIMDTSDMVPNDEPNVTDQSMTGNSLEAKMPNEFSSESFKLEISNLPNKIKYHMAKNLVEHHFKLKVHRKIKVGRGRIYITFSSESERDNAMTKISDMTWKDKKLDVRVALPCEDPFVKCKRIHIDRGNDKEDETSETVIPLEDQINYQVCPLWDRDYDIQLKIKERSMRAALNMYKQIKKFSPNSKKDDPLYKWNQSNIHISCPFHGVARSPILNGYRNKCEFNVDRDGNVGFRLGRYKDGSDRVVRPPPNCPIVNESMFKMISILETFLKGETKLKGYDPVNHKGHLRQMTVRTNVKKECLIIIDMHNQDLSQSDIDAEIESVVKLLKSETGVISIYFNISEKAHLTSQDQSLKLVYGEKFLHERLRLEPNIELDFRIGPSSFFQVNTLAAEVLYNTIIEFAELNSKSVVIDFGCGIGTISLSLANRVNHVMGIEIVQSAVEDARVNAELNGIENVSFCHGRAEDLINESIYIMKRKLSEQNIDGEIVAIVDPPRVGFNTSFVKSLRASPIKKLVYIACDPKANANLSTLCRPQSKAYQGDPFIPKKAKAIDLFPHTKCCELVIIYERLECKEKSTI